jgi:EF hand domain-containing protein
MNTRHLFIAAASGLILCMANAAPIAAQPAAGHSTAGIKAQPSTRTDAIFHALDTNKDGSLSPQEFQAAYAGMQRLIVVEIRLREQFRLVDADHSGSINAVEYANLALVKRAGKPAPVFSAFDADKNGSLDFAEYVTAIRRLAALQPAAPRPPGSRSGAAPRSSRTPD